MTKSTLLINDIVVLFLYNTWAEYSFQQLHLDKDMRYKGIQLRSTSAPQIFLHFPWQISSAAYLLIL